MRNLNSSPLCSPHVQQILLSITYCGFFLSILSCTIGCLSCCPSWEELDLVSQIAVLRLLSELALGACVSEALVWCYFEDRLCRAAA